MEESDPFFTQYDSAYWYALGYNTDSDLFEITPEIFALEYANDCKLYHQNKPNGFACLKLYMENYISQLDCFADIVSQ